MPKHEGLMLSRSTVAATRSDGRLDGEAAELPEIQGDAPKRRRVGYVFNCFPNFIEAMIYREVMALRDSGHELVTFSIRRPQDADVPAEAARLVDDTIYILPVRPWGLISAHL